MAEEEQPSKSQRKRDMDGLRVLAQRLANLSVDQLDGIEDARIRDEIVAAQKITKGNAKKRQIQFVAKLLSRTDIEPIQRLIDSMDASSVAYVQKFHRLEEWRERLIEQDPSVQTEIFAEFPQADRQQLRQLVKKAVAERERETEPQTQFRKLFQFLKSLQTQTN